MWEVEGEEKAGGQLQGADGRSRQSGHASAGQDPGSSETTATDILGFSHQIFTSFTSHDDHISPAS